MEVLRRVLQLRFIRFLVSGGLNTAATYGLYLFLLQWFSYRLSYTIAFSAGIVLAYFINRLFVFRSHSGVRTVVLLPVVYMVQYALGVAVLFVWIEVLGLAEKLGPLVVVAVTLPVTYLLSKLSFSRAA